MLFRMPRARLRFVVVIFALVAFAFVLLPYDNPVWLAVRFNTNQLRNHIYSLANDESWISRLPSYPINIADDVGVIVKTGYGTRQRLPAALNALETGFAARDVVVLADFTPGNDTQYSYNGANVKVHDVFAIMLQDPSLEWLRSTRRVGHYLNLTAAITGGDLNLATEICKAVGWELDAMKFIPGLKLALDLMPHKKWYIMIDDDTYLVRPSMHLLLEHLDPNTPQYLGNAVGDFRGRFAHGGSAVLLSRPSLERLFGQSPKAVGDAYNNALTETWGDKLVATSLIKIGIYLDERYVRFFNGERPLTTRISINRFCSPLATFHSLADPQRMKEIAEAFKDLNKPVLWHDIWNMYHHANLSSMLAEPIKPEEDHVGRTDEQSTVIGNTMDVTACLNTCQERSDCLAWTWDKAAKQCRISPWMIVGEKSPGIYSGLNTPRVRKFLETCPGSIT